MVVDIIEVFDFPGNLWKKIENLSKNKKKAQKNMKKNEKNEKKVELFGGLRGNWLRLADPRGRSIFWKWSFLFR